MENNYLLLAVAGILALLLILVIIWLVKMPKGKFVEENWENDKIRSRYYVNKKGIREGLHTFYFRNGKVNKESNWVNNKLQGKSVIYYATGEKYIDANYNEGKLDGDYNVYSKEGKIIWSATYKEGILLTQNNSGVIDVENPKVTRENISAEDLFDQSLMEVFDREKEEYSVMREEEETRDVEKSKSGFIAGALKVGRVVSGVEAYRSRKSSNNIKVASEELYDSAFKISEAAREKLNTTIAEFGTFRLISLQKTTGRFLGMLKDMNQNNKIKEYDILAGVGINNQEIKKMNGIDMATSQALKSSATVGALGAAAAMGTPTLVTGAVGALATASTGTAISGLSGVAATNATLAWLGGGSLAAGGGGMAAGATTLAALTAGASAGIGLIAAGLIASTYYSKKLTETKGFQKEVETKVADMEKLWAFMEGINKRTFELRYVTDQLTERLVKQLEFLEPLVVDYNSSNSYYNTVFQKTGLLAKSMSELAQTPLLDEAGRTSDQSAHIIQQTYKVLNEKLTNHG